MTASIRPAISAEVPEFGKFAPLPDITALEAANLSLLFVVCAAHKGWPAPDAAGFIRDKGLERHFTKDKP